MLMRGGDSHEIKRLQQALLDLDYPLPRWGADGDLGNETLAALGTFLQAHGAEADSDPTVVSDEELALLYKVLGDTQGPLGTGFAAALFHDLRKTASMKHDYGQRQWNKVTGICLHQTACNLGENPARWATVGCHLGLTRNGQGIWLHDFDRLIVHGNGWNNGCVGIEMDGLYAGVEGDITTVWNDPSTNVREKAQDVTPQLIEAGLNACRWICREVEKHGGKIKVIVAHRQASDSRRNDPGSRIWKAVALPLQAELGLGDGGRGFTLDKGLPIPEEWNPEYRGIKY